MNIPNILSLVRIILTPLFIILLFADFKMAKVFALLVFAIAAITDAYDGHLARKYNQITPEGKFLDPLADKILVLSAFISFAFINIIDFWMVGLIIFRDLFVTGLRFIMSSRGFEFVTSKLSKYKTAFQLTIIILTLIFLAIEGFNIGSNTGKVAGQSINHCHIHLIPRREGDVENPQGGVRGVIPSNQHYIRKPK